MPEQKRLGEKFIRAPRLARATLHLRTERQGRPDARTKPRFPDPHSQLPWLQPLAVSSSPERNIINKVGFSKAVGQVEGGDVTQGLCPSRRPARGERNGSGSDVPRIQGFQGSHHGVLSPRWWRVKGFS